MIKNCAHFLKKRWFSSLLKIIFIKDRKAILIPLTMIQACHYKDTCKEYLYGLFKYIGLFATLLVFLKLGCPMDILWWPRVLQIFILCLYLSNGIKMYFTIFKEKNERLIKKITSGTKVSDS